MFFILKLSIIKFNKTNNIFYVIDKSNEDLKYSRVIIRKFLLNNLNHKKKIERDLIKINYYLPYYLKMIFHIFNEICIILKPSSITINFNNYFKEDMEVRIKIIDIIYKYLMPNRNPLRYKKILNLLEILKKSEVLKYNLAGLSIKKENFLIVFYI